MLKILLDRERGHTQELLDVLQAEEQWGRKYLERLKARIVQRNLEEEYVIDLLTFML